MNDVIYKYRKADFNSILSLVSDNLWFSKPKYFNDPFETLVNLPSESYQSLIHDFYHLFIESKEAKLDKSLKDLDKTMSIAFPDVYNKVADSQRSFIVNEHSEKGVCCFSEINDSILLWSHYSQDHTGIVIAYKTNSFNSSLFHIAKVNYSKSAKLPEVKRSDSQNREKIINKMLLTKYSDWKYEKEIRVIYNKKIPKDNKGINLQFKNSIDHIIIGIKTDPLFLTILNRLLPDIELMQCKYINGTYRLEVINI